MSRRIVLELLRAQADKYLSGEEIGVTLGMSRTAVWKAVDALRKEGYEIDARTGLGYRLMTTPDAVTEKEIRGFLRPTGKVGLALYCFEELTSTNDRLKQMETQGAADGTVVIADGQTMGRGRMGRSFSSPAGQGLYLSALLKPSLPPERLSIVTAMAGVAVCDAVERVCGLRPGIKWPNDPVMGGRKVCGILTELSIEGESRQLQCLVVGIGVNVRQTARDFPPEVRETATSLLQETGRHISRPALAAALVEELDGLYAALQSGETDRYLARFRRDCVTLGKHVRLLERDGSFEEADALEVDERFGLLVRDGRGRERVVRSGEVSVRGLYGYLDE